MSLRAESNRSCEKKFQLMWQDRKARGRRRKRRAAKSSQRLKSLSPPVVSSFFGCCGAGGTDRYAFCQVKIHVKDIDVFWFHMSCKSTP